MPEMRCLRTSPLSTHCRLLSFVQFPLFGSMVLLKALTCSERVLLCERLLLAPQAGQHANCICGPSVGTSVLVCLTVRRCVWDEGFNREYLSRVTAHSRTSSVVCAMCDPHACCETYDPIEFVL